MNIRKSNPYGVMLVIFGLFIWGCGGGSSSDSNVADSIVSGVASKGIISDGLVTVYAVSEDGSLGEILGSAETDAEGHYSINIGSHKKSAVIVVTGGSYTDEATGLTVDNTRLRAVIPESGGNEETAVTPLTEIAVQLADETYTLSRINNVNAAVAVLIGWADITETQPQDIEGDLSGATDAEKDYTMILATISQMVEDGSATDVDDAIAIIKSDLEDDGELAHDGSGAGDLLEGALGNFIASEENNTGLTEEDITLDEAIAEVPATPYFFSGTDGENGGELWTSDGTEEGTFMVKDINEGVGDSFPDGYTEFNGKTYFTADDGVNGREIWVTDGTEAGTEMAIEIDESIIGSYPGGIVAFKGKLYIDATDGTGAGFEMWVSDGTDAGTTKVLNSDGGSVNSTGYMRVLGDKMVFTSATDPWGRELWVTDGTQAGTHILKDINPDGAYANPSNLVIAGDKLYFTANDGVSGVNIWITDGTEAGTQMVKDIREGYYSDNIKWPQHDGSGGIFFFANDGVNGCEVWTSDGTEAGTIMVKNINSGTEVCGLVELRVLNGKAYFFADDGVNGNELWVTDGTEAGTTLLKDIYPGATGQTVGYSWMAVLNGKIIFAANDGTNGKELWTSDGTEAGTYMVKDGSPDAASSDFYWNWVHNDKMYYILSANSLGYEIWVSDGTEAGTHITKDINPGEADGYIDEDF